MQALPVNPNLLVCPREQRDAEPTVVPRSPRAAPHVYAAKRRSGSPVPTGLMTASKADIVAPQESGRRPSSRLGSGALPVTSVLPAQESSLAPHDNGLFSGDAEAPGGGLSAEVSAVRADPSLIVQESFLPPDPSAGVFADAGAEGASLEAGTAHGPQPT